MTIMIITDVLIENASFSKKKDGTPTSAAKPKHISCLFVRLNITLLFTFVRSRGTEIYDAAINNPFCFRELFFHYFYTKVP